MTIFCEGQCHFQKKLKQNMVNYSNENAFVQFPEKNEHFELTFRIHHTIINLLLPMTSEKDAIM